MNDKNGKGVVIGDKICVVRGDRNDVVKSGSIGWVRRIEEGKRPNGRIGHVRADNSATGDIVNETGWTWSAWLTSKEFVIVS